MGYEVLLPTQRLSVLCAKWQFQTLSSQWQKSHLTNLLCLICSELQPLHVKGQAMPWLLGGLPGDAFPPYLRQMLQCVLL